MYRRRPLLDKFDSKVCRIVFSRVHISSDGNLQHNRAPTPPIENWFSTEPGSSVDIVNNPIGQRNNNRRGGEETTRKGRNQAAVSGYSNAHPWRLEANTDSATIMETGRPVIDRLPTGGIPLPSKYDQPMSSSI